LDDHGYDRMIKKERLKGMILPMNVIWKGKVKLFGNELGIVFLIIKEIEVANVIEMGYVMIEILKMLVIQIAEMMRRLLEFVIEGENQKV
jgi:hypothetical protein